MTVASDPLFEGERNPRRAKTEQKDPQNQRENDRMAKHGRTERNADHSEQLCAVADQNREDHRVLWRTEDLAVDELPAPVFLDILLFSKRLVR